MESYDRHLRTLERALDLSKPGARCPPVPVLTTNVVDEDGELWEYALVRPDPQRKGRCQVRVDCSGESRKSISCDSMNITTVLDIPPETKELLLGYNAIQEVNLTSLPDDSPLTEVGLNFNNISTLDAIHLPASVKTLHLGHNSITELKFSRRLANLITLDVSGNPITRVLVEASGIMELLATDIPLPSLTDLHLPPSITTLDLSWNPTMRFTNFYAPTDLVTFLAAGSNITALRSLDFSTATGFSSLLLPSNTISQVVGVQFPPTITRLHLNDSAISCFIIRESDVATLQKLPSFGVGSIQQTSCAATDARGATTQQLTIGRKSFPFSVLDDDTFASRFFPSNATVKPTESPAPALSPSPSTATPPPPTTTSSNLAAYVAVTLFAIAFFGVGVLLLWTCVIRKKFRADATAELASGSSSKPSETEPDSTSNSSSGDVRGDPLVLAKRMSHRDVEYKHELGRGAFGVVYLAQIVATNETVVAKKLRPEMAKDSDAIAQFTAEISLLVQLSHPRIVACLGVAWSTLTDLTVVMEYLPLGDLASLLKDHHPDHTDWTWGSVGQRRGASPPLRSKLQLAVDVADALVYLHGLESPVIHRDIKAVNVLMAENWVAKLADFGVSRNVGTQMTAEVGTVAWTAPEVLTGSVYTTAADIFSFGVLLSELDTCEKPYHDGSLAVPAAVAMAVAEGGLRPALRIDCPEAVRAIVMACLEQVPAMRPTAAELRERLIAAMVATKKTEVKSISI